MKRLPVIMSMVVATYLAMVGFVLWPFWRNATTTKAEIAQARRILNSRQSESGVDDEALSARLQSRADTLDRYIIQTNDDVGFFDHIESLAKNEGVTAAIRFLEEPVTGKIQVIRLEVAVTGSYHATLSFLGALEVQPFVVRVTDLTMQTDDQASGAIRTIATMQTLWE